MQEGITIEYESEHWRESELSDIDGYVELPKGLYGWIYRMQGADDDKRFCGDDPVAAVMQSFLDDPEQQKKETAPEAAPVVVEQQQPTPTADVEKGLYAFEKWQKRDTKMTPEESEERERAYSVMKGIIDSSLPPETTPPVTATPVEPQRLAIQEAGQLKSDDSPVIYEPPQLPSSWERPAMTLDRYGRPVEAMTRS